MEPLEDEFGDIIQKARTGLGLTVKQVAERTDIPDWLIEEMESYRHMPSEEEVVSLSRTLKLNAVKLYAIARRQWRPEELPSDRLSDIVIVDGSIGSYKVRGYILMDEKSREAVAFDTANSSRKVLKSLKERGLRLKYLLLTHGHADHTGELREICRATGAGVGIPEGEPEIASGEDIRRGMFWIKDGMEITLGPNTIKSVVTPGHTRGSTCYVTRDYCFSGDTLFAGSIGRAYSPEGYHSLLRNVRSRLLSLDKGVYVFPGHGPVTTVGEEAAHNPFF